MTTAIFFLLAACGEPAAPPPAPKAATAPAKVEAPPVGPDGPSHLVVPDLGTLSRDPVIVAAGETAFGIKGCIACHAWGSKLVGPDLTGITDRRSIVWIERMIRHPDAMTKEDPVAKGLLKAHMTQMPNQNVNDAELAAIIAYLDTKKGT